MYKVMYFTVISTWKLYIYNIYMSGYILYIICMLISQ